MEVIRDEQLDQVSGGRLWAAVIAFFYLNLEKINESLNGLTDGFEAGFNDTTSNVQATCKP